MFEYRWVFWQSRPSDQDSESYDSTKTPKLTV